MSNKHKYPTISFRISDSSRREIEARIKASGMLKKIILSVPVFITGYVLWVKRKRCISLWIA